MRFKRNLSTDPVLRSLLIKAMRRGNLGMVRRAVAALLREGDLDWLKKRILVEAFESCWPLGASMRYSSEPQILLEQCLCIARKVKNRQACGLGIAAYQVSEGALGLLEGLSSEQTAQVSAVAAALPRMREYWEEARAWRGTPEQENFIQHAFSNSKKASWPWDKSFFVAAAYLARLGPIPATTEATLTPAMVDATNFPLWVAADKHTPAGKIAIREACQSAGYSYREGIWTSFCFESLCVNQEVPALLLERDGAWRLHKVNLTPAQGQAIWQVLAPLVQENLRDTVQALERKLM